MRQPAVTPSATESPPWSILVVTLITFLLPAGGAILTIRNLARLGSLGLSEAKTSSWILVAVFGAGTGILLSLSPVDREGLPRPDPNMTSAVYLAITFAAYLVQRRPYMTWRIQNRQHRQEWWVKGFGIALVYQIFAVVAAVPIYVLAVTISGGRIS